MSPRRRRRNRRRSCVPRCVRLSVRSAARDRGRRCLCVHVSVAVHRPRCCHPLLVAVLLTNTVSELRHGRCVRTAARVAVRISDRVTPGHRVNAVLFTGAWRLLQDAVKIRRVCRAPGCSSVSCHGIQKCASRTFTPLLGGQERGAGAWPCRYGSPVKSHAAKPGRYRVRLLQRPWSQPYLPGCRRIGVSDTLRTSACRRRTASLATSVR